MEENNHLLRTSAYYKPRAFIQWPKSMGDVHHVHQFGLFVHMYEQAKFLHASKLMPILTLIGGSDAAEQMQSKLTSG